MPDRARRSTILDLFGKPFGKALAALLLIVCLGLVFNAAHARSSGYAYYQYPDYYRPAPSAESSLATTGYGLK